MFEKFVVRVTDTMIEHVESDHAGRATGVWRAVHQDGWPSWWNPRNVKVRVGGDEDGEETMDKNDKKTYGRRIDVRKYFPNEFLFQKCPSYYDTINLDRITCDDVTEVQRWVAELTGPSVQGRTHIDQKITGDVEKDDDTWSLTTMRMFYWSRSSKILKIRMDDTWDIQQTMSRTKRRLNIPNTTEWRVLYSKMTDMRQSDWWHWPDVMERMERTTADIRQTRNGSVSKSVSTSKSDPWENTSSSWNDEKFMWSWEYRRLSGDACFLWIAPVNSSDIVLTSNASCMEQTSRCADGHAPGQIGLNDPIEQILYPNQEEHYDRSHDGVPFRLCVVNSFGTRWSRGDFDDEGREHLLMTIDRD